MVRTAFCFSINKPVDVSLTLVLPPASLLTILLAIIPHDLAPSWIGKDADWNSTLGNAASILGFFASLFSLIVTFLVKRQVGRIEAEYTLRTQSGTWIKQLNDHTDRLQGCFNPFDLASSQIELTRVNSLIEAMNGQLPPELESQGRQLRVDISSSLQKAWFSREIRLDSKRAFELYLLLIKFRENLRHSVKRAQYRPTR